MLALRAGAAVRFWSRMGAARLGQAASDAVIVTARRSLTWAKAVTLAVWPVEHCVRIEGVRGSNPLSSTEFQQFSGSYGFDLGFAGEPSGEPYRSLAWWRGAATARTASTSITVATAATPPITVAARGAGAASCPRGTARTGSG